MDLISALGVEAFVSIHMSVFVLFPLSRIIAKENSKKLFFILFGIRAAILLFFDLFITTNIAILDFFAVFVGAFIVVPLSIFKGTQSHNMDTKYKQKTNAKAQSEANNVFFNGQENMDQTDGNQTENADLLNPYDFDPMFSLSEEACLDEFIRRELGKANIENTKRVIPEAVLRRKNIFNVIFAVLLYIYVSLIFFHFPILVYVIGMILLVIYLILTNRYKLNGYIKKEIKQRPQEKMSSIIMNISTTLVSDYSRKLRAVLIIVAVLGALITFAKPRIMYEKTDGGYNVRFYTFGLTNLTEVKIPDSYKGEPVVGLRGNTFSNMPLLRFVTLPDTVKEIRGQAFKNCVSIKFVELPENLEYLGGGAFYNCTSLESIEIPDTVTYLGGESFYNCVSLRTAKLSSRLTEIRGNTFEECSMLESIVIPDGVVRIGGHAFYGNTSLRRVEISPNSQLKEIGSSAFRRCDSLKTIALPPNVLINERAFKETYATIIYYGFE